MSKFRNGSRVQYWHHCVYTTLLITHYSFGTQSLWCYLGRCVLDSCFVHILFRGPTQQPHAVERHQDRKSHIGQYRHPHGTQPQ
jgi:hypothetical protein